MVKTRLPKRKRQELILAELRASATVRISDLADRLGVSGETIRRDLEEMGRDGLINRTYGGAIPRPFGFEPGWNERSGLMNEERERVAELACGLMQPGEALMIDSGTTTMRFARRLAAVAKDLTIITNSLPVAIALGTNPSFQVISCPGPYDAREGCVTGLDTINFLNRFHANRTVISASGLTVEGPTEVHSGAAAVKRVMLKRAAERILLLDHSKYDQPHLEIVCPLAEINRLITDAPAPPLLGSALRIAGVDVMH